jgi:hypothetical protein
MVGRLGMTTLAAMMVGLGSSGSHAGDTLASQQWHSRVLLVIAGDAKDPKLVEQRTVFAAMASGARERDLKLVEAVGHGLEAAALRQRFGVTGDGFRALLIGKDGGDKLSSDEPLGADSLFPLIDAMPMRQQEMRRRS